MNRLAERNDVIAVLVHDPMARELPAGGRLLVSDGELQVTLDTADGTVRERLLAQSTGRIQNILDWQRTIGVPVLPISTAEDVADQVRVLLGRAAQARRG